jgi:2-methylcitrate dehydratase PrpD
LKTISEQYANFLIKLNYQQIPDDVLFSAKRHILDTIGVAIRGRAHENAVNSLKGLTEVIKNADCISVWGSKVKLSTEYAALANGIAAHCLDFDDTHTDSILHGSTIIAPVVLALGEELNVSEEELLTAFIGGWEVAARIGLASKGSFHKRGFHTTSIAGIFGAVAAASKLLHLSENEIVNALGLAGSQASGVNEYLSNSSSSKSMHAGWSAFSGILSTRFAKNGMTGPHSVFEGRDGIFKTYGIFDECDLSIATSSLFKTWETTRISIKPYPCCHFAHAFIDCIGSLLEKGIQIESISAIKCYVPEIEQALICEPFSEKLRPATTYGAKFSLPFLLATKLLDKKINHNTFSLKNLNRNDVEAISDLVSYENADPSTTMFPKTFPGHLSVTLKDGRCITERLDINIGHPDNPISQGLLLEKFYDNCSGLISEQAIKNIMDLVMLMPKSSIRDITAATQITV